MRRERTVLFSICGASAVMWEEARGKPSELRSPGFPLATPFQGTLEHSGAYVRPGVCCKCVGRKLCFSVFVVQVWLCNNRLKHFLALSAWSTKR